MGMVSCPYLDAGGEDEAKRNLLVGAHRARRCWQPGLCARNRTEHGFGTADGWRREGRWVEPPSCRTTGSAATTRAGPRLDVNQGAPPGAAFTITLTGDGVTPADLLAVDDLGDVTLAAEPLLTADDLLAYDVTSHVFTLTMEAAGRVAALDVPTNGRGFVVAVEGTPIYAGAFWAPYSSLSYDGVVILVLPGYSAGAGFPSESGTFRLELGYPGSGFFRGSDPRSDPRVVDALVELGIAR